MVDHIKLKIISNLRVKLLFSVVLVVSLVLGFSLHRSVSREREVLEESAKERAIIVSSVFDATIFDFEDIQNIDKIQSNIYKSLWLHPEVIKVSVILPKDEGMTIVASNLTEDIGSLARGKVAMPYERDESIFEVINLTDNTQALNLIAPIRVGGQRVGSYDIQLSLEREQALIDQQQREMVMTVLINIISIIIILLVFLERLVIIPINDIKKGLDIIGGGNLNCRIKPRSDDEIGELAEGVNQMCARLRNSYNILEEKVSERTTELESLKTSLEKKVQKRTKELKEKIFELEEFNELATGRELRMVELKKEIEELKKTISELEDK